MSADRRRRPTGDGLARRLARGQQGRARPPLRRVGGERARPLESAVAAAAMAQDELGHARATYPVLGKLGIRGRRRAGTEPPRSRCCDEELPDWTAFIAANLLIDGMLTTLIAERARQHDRAARAARAQDPPGGGRAQGARGGVGEAAVPRRGSRARPAGGAALRGVGARLALGRARRRPRLGRRARRWPVRAGPGRSARGGPLPGRRPARAEGVTIALAEPVDWSGWDPDAAVHAVSGPTSARSAAPATSSGSASGAGRSSPRNGLPGVQLALRGRARRLRRPARGSGRAALGLERARSSPVRSLLHASCRSGEEIVCGLAAARRPGASSAGDQDPGTGTCATRARASSGRRRPPPGVPRTPARRSRSMNVVVGGRTPRRDPRPPSTSCEGRPSEPNLRDAATGAPPPSPRPTGRAAPPRARRGALIHSPPPSEPKPAHASCVRALMAHVAALLGHPEDDDGANARPIPRAIPEGVIRTRARLGASQLVSADELHPRAAADPFGPQPPRGDAPGERLAGRLGLVAQRPEGLRQRLLPQCVAPPALRTRPRP